MTGKPDSQEALPRLLELPTALVVSEPSSPWLVPQVVSVSLEAPATLLAAARPFWEAEERSRATLEGHQAWVAPEPQAEGKASAHPKALLYARNGLEEPQHCRASREAEDPGKAPLDLATRSAADPQADQSASSVCLSVDCGSYCRPGPRASDVSSAAPSRLRQQLHSAPQRPHVGDLAGALQGHQRRQAPRPWPCSCWSKQEPGTNST